MEPTAPLGYEVEYHVERHGFLHDSVYYSYFAERANRSIWEHLGLADRRVLEFGCGLGQNIALHRHAVGFDISQYAIEFCRRKGINGTTRWAEVGNGYAAALSAHNLEHVSDPTATLAQLRSTLIDAGTLILILPIEGRRDRPLANDVDQHLFSWTPRTAANLVAKVDFRVENVWLRRLPAGIKKSAALPIPPKVRAGVEAAAGTILRRPQEMVLVATAT